MLKYFQPVSENWVQCDSCDEWKVFEQEGLNVPYKQIEAQDSYVCVACTAEQQRAGSHHTQATSVPTSSAVAAMDLATGLQGDGLETGPKASPDPRQLDMNNDAAEDADLNQGKTKRQKTELEPGPEAEPEPEPKLEHDLGDPSTGALEAGEDPEVELNNEEMRQRFQQQQKEKQLGTWKPTKQGLPAPKPDQLGSPSTCASQSSCEKEDWGLRGCSSAKATVKVKVVVTIVIRCGLLCRFPFK